MFYKAKTLQGYRLVYWVDELVAKQHSLASLYLPHP